MKPSQKRENLKNSGKTILRAQMRRGGNRNFWVIACYTCGWSNWQKTIHFESKDEANAAIEQQCSQHPDFIDDRTIE